MNIINRISRKMKIAKSLKVNMIDVDRLIQLIKKEVQAK